MTTEELLAEYRKQAMRYSLAVEKCHARHTNNSLDRLDAIRIKLRELGPEHARRLLDLLNDESVHIRHAAAYDAFSYAPDDGVRILREIIDGPYNAWLRLAAKDLLNAWEAGTLTIL